MREQRRPQRAKAGTMTSLYVLSFKHVISRTVCGGSHLSLAAPPPQEEPDDDYESPYSGDDAESVEDYELPNDDMVNDYEPPPSQPSEELKVGPSMPIGDNDYIGKATLSPQLPSVDRFNGSLGVSIYAIML